MEVKQCLANEEAIGLRTALLFLHVAELREWCEKLSLPSHGKKGMLVGRIIHFLTTGQVIKEVPIPQIARAQRGVSYPLLPSMLMLKGAYKNDLATRQFFKKLVGDQFHFTAFGIDWLNERWQVGNPPTYQEFADMWKKEYARRKEEGTTPKEEWAYITFVQTALGKDPHLSHAEIIHAWKDERDRQIHMVQDFFDWFLSEK